MYYYGYLKFKYHLNLNYVLKVKIAKLMKNYEINTKMTYVMSHNFS